MNSPQKIVSIQVLRGIAILLIVFFHLQLIEVKYGRAPDVLPARSVNGSGGPDLFFVISGFATVMMTRGKFRSRFAALAFLYNRFTRFYPLYWVYSLLALGVYLYNPTLVNAAQGNQVDLLASFLLLPSHLLPLLNVGWFLIYQVYFALVFTLFLLVLPEQRLGMGLAIWSGWIGVGQWIGAVAHWSADPTFAIITNPVTLEFIAGCVVAKIIYAKFFRFRRLALGAGIALVVTAFAVFHVTTLFLEEYDWARVVAFGVPFALILYGMIAREFEHKRLRPFGLDQIGDASFSIYLAHIPLLTLCGRLWSRVETPGFVGNFLALSGMLLGALLFGLANYRWLERPLLEKTRAWGKPILRRWFGDPARPIQSPPGAGE
ncbi:MAG: acyltransferase [Chloroflexi bacterium]|nr:acyltransferase [Chloroflexota bacterium]